MEEPIDVPEVIQLPELTSGKESPPDFADMVLTQWLRYDCALLYAEQPWNEGADSCVSWLVHPRERGFFSQEFEAGISPTFNSFRASLDYIRERYIGGDVRRGFVERRLRQGGRVCRCLLYFSTAEHSGFWLRAYAQRGA